MHTTSQTDPQHSDESLAALDALEETLLALAHWEGAHGQPGELRQPLPPALAGGTALVSVQRLISRLRASVPLSLPLTELDVVAAAARELGAAAVTEDVTCVTEAMTEAHETTPAAMVEAAAPWSLLCRPTRRTNKPVGQT